MKVYEESHEVQEGRNRHQDRKEVGQAGRRGQGHARQAQSRHGRKADVELKESEWTDVEETSDSGYVPYMLLLHLHSCHMGWAF